MRISRILVISICALLLSCQATPDLADKSQQALGKAPNIVLIVADDMGLTDLGAFGSEISTPNLDRIANNGIKLANFHASPQCAPTRSILMSGTDNHTAGMGSMFDGVFIKDWEAREGYEGYLHPRVASMPERLRDAGYRNYMVGKWHLGGDDEKKPTARGFDNAFALMQGSANHMHMIGPGARAPVYREHGKVISSLPEDFYTTDTYTDKMLGFLEESRSSDKPFFAYMAYTSPHWPLQVPEEYLGHYAGRYDAGYEVLRSERVASAVKLGLVPDVDPDSLEQIGKPWSALSPAQQRYSSRSMELYAAMVENMDDNVGRLVAYLESIGELENTFFFFMSDNGAESDTLLNPTFGNAIATNDFYDNSYENMGNGNSWIHYGPGWAQAGSGPYRLFKGFLTEGGTRSSAFAYHPKLASTGSMSEQYLTVKDVMPTFLDLARAEFDPVRYQGRAVEPIQGKSFVAVLNGTSEIVHPADEVMAMELHGQRSLRLADWKLVWEQPPVQMWWEGKDQPQWRSWQLYNLASDPTEKNDLAESEPEKRDELIALWEEWADDFKVRRNIERYWQKPLQQLPVSE